MESWFKIWRGIERDGLFEDDAAFRVYLAFSYRAAIAKSKRFIDNYWMHFNVGESIYSIKQVASETGLSEHKVRSAIDRLVSMKLIKNDAKRRKGSKVRVLVPDPDFFERGFVQVPRSLYDNKKLMRNATALKVLIYASINAVHTDGFRDGEAVIKGDVLVDRRTIQHACGLSASQTSAAINSLYKLSCLDKVQRSEKSTK